MYNVRCTMYSYDVHRTSYKYIVIIHDNTDASRRAGINPYEVPVHFLCVREMTHDEHACCAQTVPKAGAQAVSSTLYGIVRNMYMVLCMYIVHRSCFLI